MPMDCTAQSLWTMKEQTECQGIWRTHVFEIFYDYHEALEIRTEELHNMPSPPSTPPLQRLWNTEPDVKDEKVIETWWNMMCWNN